MRPLLILTIVVLPAFAAPEPVTFEQANARLRHVYSLAQESTDDSLAARALDLRDRVKTAFARKDLVAAERLIRDAEELVGLDPGGKTMLGLPVAQIDPAIQKDFDARTEKLAAAMRKEDVAATKAAAGEIAKLLGDRAGVPDLRRKGDTGKPIPMKPAAVAELFVKALEADPRVLKTLSAGVPGPETMPRAYASVVQGCLLIRPLVEQHHKAKLDKLDGLVHGCCRAMLALQLEAGHFKFPDLRGKPGRFNEMIERLVSRDAEAVRDGWLVVPDPAGSSQWDAAECGIALLRAGSIYKVDDWTNAGRKAADWSTNQSCVPDWNYNAFSVSLLCEAFRAIGEKKYLDGALKKYQLGIAPGQGPTGRWLDPHNARTACHVILLRAVQDLEEALPAGTDRDAAAAAARKAVQSLLEEAEKLGAPATSHTVQEFGRYLRLHPKGEAATRRVLEHAASAAIQKCSANDRVRAAVPLPELAAAGGVWGK